MLGFVVNRLSPFMYTVVSYNFRIPNKYSQQILAFQICLRDQKCLIFIQISSGFFYNWLVKCFGIRPLGVKPLTEPNMTHDFQPIFVFSRQSASRWNKTSPPDITPLWRHQITLYSLISGVTNIEVAVLFFRFVFILCLPLFTFIIY